MRFPSQDRRMNGLPWCLLLALMARGPVFPARGADSSGVEEPVVIRPTPFLTDPGTGGVAICYGPFRDGQRPGGDALPSSSQIEEDLKLLSQHWKWLRLYSSVPPAETVLRVIRERNLDLKVVLGVWIAMEQRFNDRGEAVVDFPEARKANHAEVAASIDLAGRYPEVVRAVSVGNETQVFWSDHRIPLDLLIGYVRQIRSGTRVAVTVADDFNFWNKPESARLARELDFLVTHIHPVWAGLPLDGALPWSGKILGEVRAMHPSRNVVLGEIGWATSMHSEGEQARLIKGKMGDQEQAVFYRDFRTWVNRERVNAFYFEAFDEKWKGGDYPDEAEKHWGLFRSDRTPKPALGISGARP